MPIEDRVLVKTIDDPELTNIAQVLSNPTARRILKQLIRETSPSEISKAEKLPLSTVSFHIEKMVEAGLVEKTRSIAGERGRKKLYRLKFPSMLILLSPNIRITRSRVYTPFFLGIKEIALAILVASVLTPIIAGLIVSPLQQVPLQPAAERGGKELTEFAESSANNTLQPKHAPGLAPQAKPRASVREVSANRLKVLAIHVVLFAIVSLSTVLVLVLAKKAVTTVPSVVASA
ncbi:MAG: hypothetical protein DRN99_00145 [Thermoproteota archaeon]|nr:MAG: hypothetical protein DRN99_00145 [Candidatus Korarchaeota archaeon]